MRLSYLLVSIVSILFIPVVFSLDANMTVFTFRDATDNRIIGNIGVYVIEGKQASSFFVPEGVLRLSSLDCSSGITIKAGDYSTPGNDYYQFFEPDTLENGVANIYLFPVGSCRGVVKDSLDNVVPYAKLKFDCLRKFYSLS